MRQIIRYISGRILTNEMNIERYYTKNARTIISLRYVAEAMAGPVRPLGEKLMH